MIYNNLLIHENIFDELLSKVSNKKFQMHIYFMVKKEQAKKHMQLNFLLH